MVNFQEILDRIKASSDISLEKEVNVSAEVYGDIEKEEAKERLRKAKLENDSIDEANKGDVQDREQRKQFAENIFTTVCLYVFAVVLILFACGAEWVNFSLSENILITLLGTTTANILGILIIVVTYLFTRKKK